MKITIITGFLGAGKTTLLRRLLHSAPGLRLGVIVNDVSDLEVDGDLVREPGAVHETLGNFASITDGSISGSRLPELMTVLNAWKARTDLDHVIIETSGSTHPWPLIEAIVSCSGCVLQSFVTLIDARAFSADWDGGRLLNDDSAQPHAPLMLAQIALADVILFSKAETLPPTKMADLAHQVVRINAHADLYAVNYGKIQPAVLLGKQRFDHARAQTLAKRWQESAVGEPGQYDLGSTVVADARPLHPRRLWTLIHDRLGLGVHRSKGFLWLPSRDRDVLLWNQAAGSVELELTAYWKAALVNNPDGRLVSGEIEQLKTMLQGAHPAFGDRACELTVIGQEADRAVFVRELQACFCTPDEVAAWQRGESFDDPWPRTLRRLE